MNYISTISKIVIFMLFSNQTKCQTCQNEFWRKVDFNYEFVHVSYIYLSNEKIHFSHYEIIIDLPEEKLMSFCSLTKECKLDLLMNPESSWKTNLLLYNCYRKDATSLQFNDETNWTKLFRQEDIDFWTEFLGTGKSSVWE